MLCAFRIVRGTRGAVRVLETKDEVSPARLGTMNKAGSTPSNTVVKREQFPALAGCSDGAALRAAGAPTTSMIAWARFGWGICVPAIAAARNMELLDMEFDPPNPCTCVPLLV